MRDASFPLCLIRGKEEERKEQRKKQCYKMSILKLYCAFRVGGKYLGIERLVHKLSKV